MFLLINFFNKQNRKPYMTKGYCLLEEPVKLGRRQCLVLNINPNPGLKERSRWLDTERGQMWLQETVTMHKLSLPLSGLQAVGYSTLLSFK